MSSGRAQASAASVAITRRRRRRARPIVDLRDRSAPTGLSPSEIRSVEPLELEDRVRRLEQVIAGAAAYAARSTSTDELDAEPLELEDRVRRLEQVIAGAAAYASAALDDL